MIAPWRLSHIMDLKRRFRERYPFEKAKELEAHNTLDMVELYASIIYFRAKIALETRIAIVAIPGVQDLDPGPLLGSGCKKVYSNVDIHSEGAFDPYVLDT